MDFVIKIILGGLLLFTAIEDYRYQKVSNRMILLGFLCIGILTPFTKEVEMMERGMGIFMGLLVMAISHWSKGKIGMGDGMLLAVTGWGLGFWANLELFGIALFLAAFLSIILLIVKQVGRKYTLPFVPFLFLGYIILIFQSGL